MVGTRRPWVQRALDKWASQPPPRPLKPLDLDKTDVEWEARFGPHWKAALAILRRTETLTEHEAQRLSKETTFQIDPRTTEWSPIIIAARQAAQAAARGHAGVNADEAKAATHNVRVRCGHRTRADVAINDALRAVSAWDGANEGGFFTFQMRDLLMLSWRNSLGVPEGLS